MKKFVAGLLVGIIVMISVSALAETVVENATIYLGRTKLTIAGVPSPSETLLYNDKLYIPISEAAQQLGFTTSWDKNTNTTDIRLNSSAQLPSSGGKATPKPTVTPKPSGGDIYAGNTKWGMTKSEVKKAEGVPSYENESDLMYMKKTIFGMTADVLFGFNSKGELSSAMYAIRVTHTNSNLYVDDYYSVAKSLKAKYGTPEMDNNMTWDGGEYMKGDSSYYGLAVQLGYLTYHSTWGKGDTNVGVMLLGDNYECSLLVFYSDTSRYKK